MITRLQLFTKPTLSKDLGEDTISSKYMQIVTPILILTRELSNKPLVPIGTIFKKDFKKTNINNKGLALIPKWIKKPKIRRFNGKLFSNLHQNQEKVQNEFKPEHTVSEPKFNLTGLLNKRLNPINERTIKNDFYKAILSKLYMSPSQTKNSLIRKKVTNYNCATSNNAPEQTGTSKKSLVNNESGIRTDKIDQEIQVTAESGNTKTGEIIKKKEETTDTIENNEKPSSIVISTEPSTISDDTLDKSESVDSETVIKKTDDRSRIKKKKKQNLINEDKQHLKAKAKQFEKLYKPEVDFYIKKLADKYGKTTFTKISKPIRSYDNNQQRIKYELNNYTGNKEASKYEVAKRIDRNPSQYKEKGFHEFIKAEVVKIKSLNRRSTNEIKHVLNGSARIVNNETENLRLAKEKLKRCTLLRKDNLQRKLRTVNERYKKINNAEIKLNLSNGLLSSKGVNFKITDKLVRTNDPKNSTIADSSDEKKMEDMRKFTDNKNQQSACLNDDQNEKLSRLTSQVLKTDLEHFSNKLDIVQTSKLSESMQLKETLTGALQNKLMNRVQQNDKLHTNIVAEINARSNNQYSSSNNKNTKERVGNIQCNHQKQEEIVGSLENNFIKGKMAVHKEEKFITNNKHCKEQSKPKHFKTEQHMQEFPNKINKPENGEIIKTKNNTKIETRGQDLANQENINMKSCRHKKTHLELVRVIEENKTLCKLDNIGRKNNGLDGINKSIVPNKDYEVVQEKENNTKEDRHLNVIDVNRSNTNNNNTEDKSKSSKIIALMSNKITDKNNEECTAANENVGDNCISTKNKDIPLSNAITQKKTKTNLILSPSVSLEKISKRNMFNVGKGNRSENLNQKNLDYKPTSQENHKIHLKIVRDLPQVNKSLMNDITPHKMGYEPLFPLLSEAIKLEDEKSTAIDHSLIGKKDLDLQHQNVKSKKQEKQLDTDTTKQMNEYAFKFVDIVITENILGEKVRQNKLLMHSLNKISFIKDINEIPYLIAQKPIISKKALKINSIKDNDQDINIDIGLENDLSTIVSQQMELYLAETKNKKLNETKQKNYFCMDNLFDCSFILQSFNKVSLKNVVCYESVQSDTFKKTRETPKMISALSEANSNKKLLPLESTSSDNLGAINQVEKILTVNHKTHDVTFLEILDFGVPMNYIKSRVKESISEDSVTQMNHVNSKNMSFYSKYRMNFPVEVNRLRDKTYRDITKNKVIINRALTPNQRNGFGDDYKQSNLSRPIQYSTKPNETKGTLIIHFNGHKNSSEKSNIKEMEVNNDSSDSKPELLPTKITTLKTRLITKENQNTGKIEPEVLRYIQKLENKNLIAPANKIPSSTKSCSIVKVENSVESNSDSPGIEKHMNCPVQSIDICSEKDRTIGREHKPVHIEKKKGFKREIPCSTTIKILEKSAIKDFDIIKDSRRGNFKYLTKEIQNKKKNGNNLSKNQNQSNNDKLLMNSDVNIIPINCEKKLVTIQIGSALTQSNKSLPDELNSSSITSNSINNVGTTYEVHIKTKPTLAETRMDGMDSKGNITTFSTPSLAFGDGEKMTHKNLNGPNTRLLETKAQQTILKNLDNNQLLEKKNESDRRTNNNKFTRVSSSQNNTVKVEMTKENNDLNHISKKNTLTSLKSEDCFLIKPYHNANELNLVDINKNEVHHEKENIKHQFHVKQSGPSVENVIPTNKIKVSFSLPNLNKTFTGDSKNFNKIIGTEKTIASKNSTESVTALSENKSHLLKHELKEEQGMNTSENKFCLEGNSLNKERSKNNLKITILDECKENNFKIKHSISDTKNKDKCDIQNILKQKYALNRQKIDNNGMDSKVSLLKEGDKTLQRNDKNNSNSYVSRIQEILGDSYGKSKTSLSSNGNKTLKSNLSRDKNTSLCNTKKELEADPNTNADIGLTKHIPTSARCTKQHKDLTNDKDNVQVEIKHTGTSEKGYLNEAESKDNSFSKEKNINNSVAMTITKQLITDSSSSSRFNHKLHLEKINKNKRILSIKNTLSNNLKPKDEVKKIQKPPYTLIDFLNIERGRKINGENKRVNKQIEQHRQKLLRTNNIILKAYDAEKKSISDFQHTHTNHSITDNSGVNMKCDIGSSNITNDYKKFNKHSTMKSVNNTLHFNQPEFTVTENEKEINGINSVSNPTKRGIKKGVQNNNKVQTTTNASYALKQQPTIERLISQTLGVPTSAFSHAPKLGLQPKVKGIKKIQHSDYRQSVHSKLRDIKRMEPSNFKQKISKHHLLNGDLMMKKNNLKKNCNLTKSNVNKIIHNISSHNQMHIPLQGFYNEQKITPPSKQCILDAPSRQASRLLSQQWSPKIKPVLVKEKLPTNLLKCMALTSDQRYKKEFETVKKDRENSDNFVNESSNIQIREPRYKQTFEEICQIKKTKDSKIQCPSSGAANRITNNKNTDLEGGDNRINYVSAAEANIKERNESCPMANSKKDSFNIDSNCSFEKNLPFFVDTVVNKVKAKLQNLPSSVSKMMSPNKIKNSGWLDIRDIVKHKTLLKGSESIRKWQKKVNNFQKQIAYTGNSKHSLGEINKRNDTCNDNKKQVLLPYKTYCKIKTKSKKKGRDVFQGRRISDLLKFKPKESLRTCPQMSYSEVLNKFYISSDHAAVK